VAALAAAPTAVAAPKKSGAAHVSSFAPIAKKSQSRRTLARRISSVRRRTARAERRLRALGTTISSQIAAVRAAFAATSASSSAVHRRPLARDGAQLVQAVPALIDASGVRPVRAASSAAGASGRSRRTASSG
jgi:hypothetical protein